MRYTTKTVVFSLFLCVVLTGIPFSNSHAQSVDNVQQGAPGTLINGPIDPDAGRLTTLEYLGGYIIAIPEVPGSEPSDHLTVKAWDFSDLNNPVAGLA